MLPIFRSTRSRSSARQINQRKRFSFESLENRVLMARDTFNDPNYAPFQWHLSNTGQTGGLYDIDIDAPEAWTVTTGSMKTVLAQIDSGVDFTHPDIYLNIWLNQDEIPAALRPSLVDTDSDGLITFRDLNHTSNVGLADDLNGTGHIDGGDLLLDSRWANGFDDGGTGRVDDLVGWDFEDGDNDPRPVATDSHGTSMSEWIGAIPNNGIGNVGVNHSISIMPVRFFKRSDPVDFTKMAAGLDYAVATGAPISGLWGGNYDYSQVMYESIERAQLAGHLVVAPAANDGADNDVTPRYPASFDLANIISATAFNASDELDPTLNWGATSVDLAGPGSATSVSAAYVAGVAALLKTVNPDWNYAQIKDRILSTVDPSAAFAGKTVTGGRLNAANALGVVQVVPSTKFYVVNDGSFDRTYEYAAAGDVTMSYNISTSGNIAPRGAASTTAGDKVWVIDANKKVYVYDASGVLLGSWTAGSLTGAAQVEGIATNGTDVWLVDGKQDKAYRYAAAAGRLSGSQNAVSSFSLNSANKNAKDIVTDGVHLWVVNDSTTDKVFKYTLSGSLVGSWTINSGGGSPTGITIDPANVSDIWIVENATDRVYQFTAAASRTSGSQSPATSFALAAGNTNPQGIADPPAFRSGIRQNSGARSHNPKSGDFGYSTPFVDRPGGSQRAGSGQATRQSALDLLFASDGEHLSRRVRRVGRAMVVLFAR